MKIGAVDFLNAYPLYWGLENNKDISLTRDIPSRLADGLFRKQMDVAIISSIEFHKHQDIFKYYSDLCISAKGKVESIRLYSGSQRQQSLEEITEWISRQENLRIYYDVATRSSLSMLKVLIYEYCREICETNKLEFIEVRPPFENIIGNLEKHEMLLLIGDSALRLRNLPSIDMGEFYFHTFHRAFVYAIWVYLPETGGNAGDILLNAYKEAQNDLNSLLSDAVKNFGFPEKFTLNYITEIIQYQFTDELKKDMNFFFDKYDKLPENLLQH